MTKEWTAEETWDSVGLRGRPVFGQVSGRIQKAAPAYAGLDHLLWIFVRMLVDSIFMNRVMNRNGFKGLHHIALNIAASV